MSPNRALLETWFQRVWAEEDTKAIFELFPRGPNHGLGRQQVVGPEEFSRFHEAICKLLRDIKVSVDHFIEANDGWISAICTLTAVGQNAPTEVAITGSVFAKVGEGGVFVECYNHWDFTTLWEQLGLLPDNIFGRCLAGESTGV